MFGSWILLDFKAEEGGGFIMITQVLFTLRIKFTIKLLSQLKHCLSKCFQYEVFLDVFFFRILKNVDEGPASWKWIIYEVQSRNFSIYKGIFENSKYLGMSVYLSFNLNLWPTY